MSSFHLNGVKGSTSLFMLCPTKLSVDDFVLSLQPNRIQLLKTKNIENKLRIIVNSKIYLKTKYTKKFLKVTV
jgi:hypothetical protein